MYIPGLNVKLTAPYGLMVLRVVLGIAFLIHGWSKFSGGVEGVAGFFTSLNIPAPSLVAYIVSIVELVGGALLIEEGELGIAVGGRLASPGLGLRRRVFVGEHVLFGNPDVV